MSPLCREHEETERWELPEVNLISTCSAGIHLYFPCIRQKKFDLSRSHGGPPNSRFENGNFKWKSLLPLISVLTPTSMPRVQLLLIHSN